MLVRQLVLTKARHSVIRTDSCSAAMKEDSRAAKLALPTDVHSVSMKDSMKVAR
jgi:hypothetical protein